MITDYRQNAETFSRDIPKYFRNPKKFGPMAALYGRSLTAPATLRSNATVHAASEAEASGAVELCPYENPVFTD